MIANLNHEESPAMVMLSIIERCAPMFLRMGGGGITQEPRERRMMTPEQKAKALELAKAGQLTGTQIAQQIGSTQASVFKLAKKAGISLPDGREVARRAKR